MAKNNKLRWTSWTHCQILSKRHADFNNPSIFWIIQEWETVTDLKNNYLCETYIKNMELIVDTLEEPICQIALYKALD